MSRIDEIHLDFLRRCLLAQEGRNAPILHYLSKYGTSKGFQEVWIQHEGDMQPKAIVMRHINHMYLYAPGDIDHEEISSFCRFIDPDFIWSEFRNLMLIEPCIPEYRQEAAWHMILSGDDRLVSCESCEHALPEDSREIARIIFSEDSFRRFYTSEGEVEIGMRRRLELGECTCVVIRGKSGIKGLAYSTIETENYAVISGVVTRPEFRRSGVAGQVVSGICRLILKKGKRPNLFYSDERAGRLYRRLGFVEDGDYGLMQKIT